MTSDTESKAFGFDRSRALEYLLDNVSRPDKWYYVGYELQYIFTIHFHATVTEEDETKFLEMLLDAFQSSFGLPSDGHYKFDVPPKNVANNVEGFLLKIFWDKGRLDLRILKRLEDEIHNVATLNKATVELVSLIIIPRSRGTIALKIMGKL